MTLPTPVPDSGTAELLDLLRTALPAGPFLERRLGRALAFQALYEMDLAAHPSTAVLERVGETADAGSGPFPPRVLQPALAYAGELLDGVRRHGQAIDAIIQERAPAWPLTQMAAVDRNVLRIGLYESLYGGAKVPVRAAINEAVDLAKVFGSESSGKFVNGVLGRAVDLAGRQDSATEAVAPPEAGDSPHVGYRSASDSPESEQGSPQSLHDAG